MVKSPVKTILVVGNRNTGKTTLIHRNLGIHYIHNNNNNTGNRYTTQTLCAIQVYYIPIDNDSCVRIIELNHGFPDTAYIPSEYRDIVDGVVIVASFENEYSIQDISYHISCYEHLRVPFHIILNKKDLRRQQDYQALALYGIEMHSINIVSCKYDDNFVNLATL